MSLFDSSRDYYKILGAEESASRADIERSYKRQALKHHPDRGGSEDGMKALNEAYQILHDEALRKSYDRERCRAEAESTPLPFAPPARDVGMYGQGLSALLCLIVGLLLLFLVWFQWIWFLWPLALLAGLVLMFGVFRAHAAVNAARDSLATGHPARRFRLAQEAGFWTAVCAGAYAVYLSLAAAQ
jgi:curved DNA-binding protein CbpA